MADKEPVFPDKTGRSLKPGDFVVYGHALGRCAGLQYGKVLAVTEGKFGYGDKQYPKLRIQGVDLDDNSDFHNPEWVKERRQRGDPKATLLKPSTLSFPSRVLRITRDQVPDEVLEVLRTSAS